MGHWPLGWPGLLSSGCERRAFHDSRGPFRGLLHLALLPAAVCSLSVVAASFGPRGGCHTVMPHRGRCQRYGVIVGLGAICGALLCGRRDLGMEDFVAAHVVDCQSVYDAIGLRWAGLAHFRGAATHCLPRWHARVTGPRCAEPCSCKACSHRHMECSTLFAVAWGPCPGATPALWRKVCRPTIDLDRITLAPIDHPFEGMELTDVAHWDVAHAGVAQCMHEVSDSSALEQF